MISGIHHVASEVVAELTADIIANTCFKKGAPAATIVIFAVCLASSDYDCDG